MDLAERRLFVARYSYNTYFYRYMTDTTYDRLKETYLKKGSKEFKNRWYKRNYPSMAKEGAYQVAANRLELPEDSGSNYTPLNLELLYVVSSYLYYELDSAILKDTAFDDVCKILYKEYDKTSDTFYRRFSLDDLSAGTGFTIKDTIFPWEREVAYIILNNLDAIDQDTIEINIQKYLDLT